MSKKLSPIIGKTIKKVYFARNEEGFLMKLELSFTDGTCASFMVNEPKMPIKCVLLPAEDEGSQTEIRL